MARIQELTMPGGNRGLLFLAVIAGLIAAVVVFVAVSNGDDGDSTASTGGNTTSAVVAAQQISAGDEITEDMLKVVDVPDDLLVTGSYEETSLVVGEFAKVSVAEGEQLTTAKVGLPVPDDVGIAGVIPEGMRAVAIEIEEVTAVGGLLLPGDRVDIVAAYRIGRAPGLADDEYILRTETILQNVEVLSVAQEAQEPTARSASGEDAEDADTTYTSGQLPDDPEEQPGAGTVTVALNPSQSLILISRQEHAQDVWVIERGYGDTGIVDLTPYDQVIVE